MAMVYQAGNVFEKGTRTKKWYGQFRVYQQDQQGKEVCKNKKVVLGLKSQMRKHEAEAKLREFIALHNGKTPAERAILPPDDSVTFDWFVKEKYLPLKRGRWVEATKKKTGYEINRYLVENLKTVPLRNVGLFELQTLLNGLAGKYSESIVKHAFVNLRSIFKVARKLKLLAENPGVATVGRWISDDEFLLDLDTVAKVNHFLFSVQFNENRVYIRMNETTGEMKNVAVEGMAEKP